MNENDVEVVRQAPITLPGLDEEAPALYLTDGRPYVPVFVVCRVLGIRAAPHIRRWKNLVFWTTARKLPFQAERLSKRLVWCLLISEVPFLYSLFDWKLVSPERRLQLYKATEAHVELLNQAYQEMQRRYKATRQLLFHFMTQCDGIESFFQRMAEMASPRLDREASLAFETLIERGRVLYRDAAALARKMLQYQGELPIIDAFKIDANNIVVDTFSMPLLPIVPQEDSARFAEYMSQLAAWHVELATFWRSWDQERRPDDGS